MVTRTRAGAFAGSDLDTAWGATRRAFPDISGGNPYRSRVWLRPCHLPPFT